MAVTCAEFEEDFFVGISLRLIRAGLFDVVNVEDECWSGSSFQREANTAQRHLVKRITGLAIRIISIVVPWQFEVVASSKAGLILDRIVAI